MTPLFRKHGSIIISIIGAIGIMVTALLTAGTEYNDTGWLYAFCVWLAAFFVFEAYSSKAKDKDK